MILKVDHIKSCKEALFQLPIVQVPALSQEPTLEPKRYSAPTPLAPKLTNEWRPNPINHDIQKLHRNPTRAYEAVLR